MPTLKARVDEPDKAILLRDKLVRQIGCGGGGIAERAFEGFEIDDVGTETVAEAVARVCRGSSGVGGGCEFEVGWHGGGYVVRVL